mgnify:FL=1
MNTNDKLETDSGWDFSPRRSIQQVEEGIELAPKFNENDILPCITQHVDSSEILMFAYMNEQALRLTIDNGFSHYWSRSRQKIWIKGETSGMRQKVHQILVDDDQDCIILKVSLTSPTKGGKEASCHVGYRTCFYREIASSEKGPILKFIEDEKAFDPEVIYKGQPNPTKI